MAAGNGWQIRSHAGPLRVAGGSGAMAMGVGWSAGALNAASAGLLDDAGSAAWLASVFPSHTFRWIPGRRGGRALVACRKDGAPGPHTVITGDPAEMYTVLKEAVLNAAAR
jgi:hypothetical protein